MPCSFHEFFHGDSFTTKNIKLKQVGIFAVDIFFVVVQISIDLSHPEIHMEKILNPRIQGVSSRWKVMVTIYPPRVKGQR